MSYKENFTDLKDLSFLQASYDLYKEYCQNYWHERAKDEAKCALDGTVNDLNLLAFIDYEDQFPDEDLYHASIIWGNVIVNHTPLIWGKDPSGELVLKSPIDVFPFYVLYPHQRFKEAIYTEMPEELPVEQLTFQIYTSMMDAVFFPEDLKEFIMLLQEFTDIEIMTQSILCQLKDHYHLLGEIPILYELFQKAMKD